MNKFSWCCRIVVVGLATYTAIVGFHHGWNLLPIFISDIAEAT